MWRLPLPGGALVRTHLPPGTGALAQPQPPWESSTDTVSSVPHFPSCRLRASLSPYGLSKWPLQQGSRTSHTTALGCEPANCQACLRHGWWLTPAVASQRSQAQLRLGGRGLPRVCTLEGLLPGPPGLWGESMLPQDSQKLGGRGHPGLPH